MDTVTNTPRTFAFQLPLRIRYGPGLAAEVGVELNQLGASHAFVITDAGVAAAGILEAVMVAIDRGIGGGTVFTRPPGEPTDLAVGDGIAAFRDSKANCIVAIGGGATIDTAKAVKVMLSNKGSICDYAGSGKAAPDNTPFVAIPTTAGTGSETNGGAVVIDSQRKAKFYVDSMSMYPNVALVDPLMTLPLPPSLTAYTGLDALAQAMGAYVCNACQPITDALALEATRLIAETLETAVANGGNLEARSAMMFASMMAGIAIGNSDCTGEHMLGETIGAHYGLPHGLTVAVFLPYVMEHNRPAATAKFAELARVLGEDVARQSQEQASRMAIDAVVRLLGRLRIPRLAELGVRSEDLETLTEKAMAHPSWNTLPNPRPMSREIVSGLFRATYESTLTPS